MRDRRSEVVRGIGALLVLALTVVGVPLLLIRLVGWPLPTEVPTAADLSGVFRRGDVTSTTLIKAFSIAVWLAWLQVTMTTIAESAAFLRGRRARRVPGPPAVRMAVANLVTSVALLVSGPIRPALAVPNDAAILHAVLADPQPSPFPSPSTEDIGHDSQTDTVERTSAPAGVTEGPSWTVGPRDTLWDIAERTLGEGRRWKEIHALNIGRQQADGRTLHPDDDLIRPGWVLELPTDARVPAGVDEGPSGGEPPDDADAVPEALFLTVDPGDTLWDLSEEHLGDPFRWPRIFEVNQGRTQPDGRKLIDPDLIHPGWELQIPSEGARDVRGLGTDGDGSARPQPRPATEQRAQQVPHAAPAPRVNGSSEAVDGARSEGRVPGTANDGREARSDTGDRDRMAAAEQDGAVDRIPLVLGGGILAAGLIATLERIRQARRRRRPAGHRIHLPEGEEAATEEHLRKLADLDGAEILKRAIASLSGRTTSHGDRVLDRLALVSTSPTELTAHLTVPQPSPPDAWRAEDHGMTWVLASSEPETLDGAMSDPDERPLLVSVGTTANGTRRVHLNLRCVRTLTVTAEPDDRRTALLSFAAELGTSAPAPHARIILTGVGSSIAELERVECIPESQEVVELLERRAGKVASASDRRDLQPLVALFGTAVTAETVDRMRSLVESCEGTAVAVVATSEPSEDGWALEKTGRGWHLAPVGLDLTPIELDQQQIEQFGGLVLQARNDPPVPVDDTQDRNGDQPSKADTPGTVATATEGAEDAPTEEPVTDETVDVIDITDPADDAVEVRILGSVHVAGIDRWPSAKSKELVAYLAMHPEGTHMDTLMEKLWPREEPNRNRLQTEISRARQTLGDAPDGRPYLPPVDHDIYRPHNSLRTDYDRFRKLVHRAERDPESSEELLEMALALVKGVPFTECDYWWASLDAHTIAAEVADTAHRLAALYLEQELPAKAAKAARKGLKADPLFEVLRRDLMRAEAAQGNTAEIHAIMSAFRKAVSEDADANDADDWMDPETVALYEELVSRTEPRAQGSSGTATLRRRVGGE